LDAPSRLLRLLRFFPFFSFVHLRRPIASFPFLLFQLNFAQQGKSSLAYFLFCPFRVSCLYFSSRRPFLPLFNLTFYLSSSRPTLLRLLTPCRAHTTCSTHTPVAGSPTPLLSPFSCVLLLHAHSLLTVSPRQSPALDQQPSRPFSVRSPAGFSRQKPCLPACPGLEQFASAASCLHLIWPQAAAD